MDIRRGRDVVLPKRAQAREGLTLATDGYPRGQNNIPASH